ncbi:MAG: GNAT family N-acetyltransferase [bacterium]|nr:GNAT family N-acetyltransferase [bacterium]
MSIEIREYRDEDRDEWMRVHATIMTISHAWNYCIQERPAYEDYKSTRLVAFVDGVLAGLTDVQYENEAGEFCFVKDSIGGYVLEFGRLPEFAGLNLGKLLMDATVEDAKRQGVRRLEYWSQERSAQRYYRRLNMKEVGRHYRFRMRAPQDVNDLLSKNYIGVEYIYGACLPDEWPLVKEKFDIIDKPPLEPHLCVGFEIRF